MIPTTTPRAIPTSERPANGTVPGRGPGRAGAPRRVVRSATVRSANFATVAELEAAKSHEDFLDRLSADDRARLEDMARQGYTDGFERGAREGYQAGMEQAVAEVGARLGSALRALTAAAERLAAADAVTLDELDGQIVGFAFDVAEAVVGRELAAAADPGADALARAIALAPDRGDIVARLHPDDVASLGEIDDLAPGRSVTIVPDSSVAPGGCVLDIGACRVDAQLGPALERVREVLR